MELKYKSLTKRRRPHFQPLDATLFVTFRLANSIPKSTVRHYKAKRDWLQDQLQRCDDGSSQETKWRSDLEKLYREWFIKSEEIMHRHLQGPTWLRDDAIAENVAENLHRPDGDLYRLDAFSIMSNHVHTIFKPLIDESVRHEILSSGDYEDQIPALAKIMQAIKGRSARECNLLLGRSGQFWEHESFDHVIRVGKFEKTMRYVLNNPGGRHCTPVAGLSMELLPGRIVGEIQGPTQVTAPSDQLNVGDVRQAKAYRTLVGSFLLR